MDYISTNFGTDSSAIFLLTHRLTHSYTNSLMQLKTIPTTHLRLGN